MGINVVQYIRIQRRAIFQRLGNAVQSIRKYWYARVRRTLRVSLNREFTCTVDAHHADFWKLVDANRWEPNTYRVLNTYLHPDVVYADIGSWIGPTVLYAAKKCKHVFCFEPDPYAFKTLLNNIHQNKFRNITPLNIALSDQSELRNFGNLSGEYGDSTTSLVLAPNPLDAHLFQAMVMDWKTFEQSFSLPVFQFVKMDIEGGEFALIPAMAEYLEKHKPVLWLSLHAPNLPEADRQKELEKLKTCIAWYDHCYDENFNEVSIDTMTDQVNCNQYTEYLFTMKEQATPFVS